MKIQLKSGARDGRNVAVLLGAMGIWLGFPNDLVFLPLVILLWPLSLAFLGLTARSVADAVRDGLAINVAGITSTLYWLAFPIHQVGDLPWIVAALAALFVATALALLYTIFPAVLFFARKHPPVTRAFVAAVVWTLLEILAGLGLDFPWIPLTGGLVIWPVLVQTAVYVGSTGTAFLWILLLLLLFFPGESRRARACGLSLLAIVLVTGVVRYTANPMDSLPEGKDSLGVLFVEGNFDQNEKWTPALRRLTLDRYRQLTRTGMAKDGDKVSLIIWPETCMPFFLENSPHLAGLVRESARENGRPLLFGIPGTDRERRIYNRAILLDDKGRFLGHVDKEHLVPFGEYVPPILDIPIFRSLLQGIGYSRGTTTAPLAVGSIAAGILICYEGIFPELAQKRVREGANILVDLSNDAWFSRTSAPVQHLYLKALRCIEQNRWLLRGTNSGISAVIDHMGRIVFRGPLFTAESLYARARLCRETTVYHRTRDMQSVLFAVFCLIAIVLLSPHFSPLYRQE